ncbi:hypothetical protein ACQJBY_059302 [Aegilops geniculata]
MGSTASGGGVARSTTNGGLSWRWRRWREGRRDRKDGEHGERRRRSKEHDERRPLLAMEEKEGGAARQEGPMVMEVRHGWPGTRHGRLRRLS